MARFCFKDLEAAVKGLMTKEDLKNLKERLRLGKERTGSLTEAAQAEHDADAAERAARRRVTYLSTQKGQQILANAQRFEGDPFKGIMSELTGVQTNKKAARYSADGLQAARRYQSYHNFTVDLEKEDLKDYFNNMPNSEELAQELFEEGTAKDPKIIQIAKIVKKYFEEARHLLNRAGANIPFLKEYVARQTHNAEVIRNGGMGWAERKKLGFSLLLRLKDPKSVATEMDRISFELWNNFTKPRLNLQKMFPDIPSDQIDESMKKLWVNISSGEHSMLTGDYLEEVKVRRPYSGPSGLEGHRVFIFNDGRTWHEYLEKFGQRTLHDQILAQLWHSGGQLGLMEKFGPRPRATLTAVVNKLVAQNKDIPKLRKTMRKAFWTMDVLEGKSGGIPDNLLGSIFMSLLHLRAMTIGNVWLSSLPDIGLFEAKARRLGSTMFVGEAEAIKNLMNFTKEHRILGEQLGTMSDTTMGAAISRYTGVNSPFSSFAKMNGIVHKLNFMQHHDFSLRKGWAAFVASHLASQANMDFESLPIGTKESLSIRGIGSDEWDLMRAPENLQKSVEDKILITPDNAREYTKKSVAKYLGKTEKELSETDFADAKSDLQAKWLNYFIDEASDVIPYPSAGTLATAYRGTRGDEIKGMVLRSFFQFKTWNIEMTKRTLGHYIYGGGANSIYDAVLNGKGDVMGMIEFMIQQLKWGYISAAAYALSRGIQPPDPLRPNTWLDASERGGGFGVYMGTLEQFWEKYVGMGLDPLTPAVARPVADTAAFVKSVLTNRRNHPTHPLFYAAKFAEHNVIPLQFFWSRLAFDHLFLYGLMERSRPGYLNRLKRYARKDGQKYIWNPEDYTNRF